MDKPHTPSGVPIDRVRCRRDPKDTSSSTWGLRVRRDVAPVYVHMLSINDYYCDDATWDDGINERRKYVYAVKVDVGVGTGAGRTRD